MAAGFGAIDALLLRREHKLCIDAGNQALPETWIQTFEIGLVQLGYVLSSQLKQRLATLSSDTLEALWCEVEAVLLGQLGGAVKHVPLFRDFPDNVPDDTAQLWWQKVYSHFLQSPTQPCLFCHRQSTTHVLNPCQHVVCDHCFDGSNYSACPICGHQVDPTSPFFLPSKPRKAGRERPTLKLLMLGERESSTRALFLSLCARPQALSPQDRDALKIIVREKSEALLAWLPENIIVRENVAWIFGILLQQLPVAQVMAIAPKYLLSATDVLRLLAAYSDVDPAIQGQTIYRQIPIAQFQTSKKLRAMLTRFRYSSRYTTLPVAANISRFKVAKLPRALRRSLLGLMESFRPAQLTEDMLRHRSYWVWLGEFLHPHEYQKRFPQVANAFTIVRKKAADGSPAPQFSGYYSQLERAVMARDTQQLVSLLVQRPGEFGRRLDHALRLCATDMASLAQVMRAFSACLDFISTPVLLTLRALLPTRLSPAAKRLYWPKSQVAKCVMAKDLRPTLPAEIVAELVAKIESQLLQRFVAKDRLEPIVIDSALASIIVPFNERTASRAAIQLPRGSSLPLPTQAYLRLFLHWCEQAGNYDSDLDLSVGFFDKNWNYMGVCSYYQLQYRQSKGTEIIASSAGDLTCAPYPNGASEFVDVHLQAAMDEGIRYAVVVINNYSGVAFEKLERAFAGLMYRDDVNGLHFDPCTVELRFNLQGSNGVFLPLVVDLQQQRMHWLDAYSTGDFAFNNVATSSNAITTLCPTMIQYFASGIRTSVYDLALLHAAARGAKVWLRGADSILVERREGEDAQAFLARLRARDGKQETQMPFAADQPIWAVLDVGDLALSSQSNCYVLRPALTMGNMAAADLLS